MPKDYKVNIFLEGGGAIELFIPKNLYSPKFRQKTLIEYIG